MNLLPSCWVLKKFKEKYLSTLCLHCRILFTLEVHFHIRLGYNKRKTCSCGTAFQYTARKCEVLSHGDWTRHLLILVAHPVCSHEALFTRVGCEGHRSQTKHDWRDEPVLPHAWFMWKNMLQSVWGFFFSLFTPVQVLWTQLSCSIA